MDGDAKLAKALIEAQKRVLSAVKDGENPAFRSKYATLDSVLAAVRGPLSECGFALIQDATSTESSVSVVTRLIHEDGGVIESSPLMATLKKEFTRDGKELPPSVQQVGALVTYLRRYSLCPFLGVSLDADDDGAAASEIGKDGGKPAQQADARAVSGGGEKDHAPRNPRKSAHTGERLDDPEAAARHRAAAEASRAGGAKADLPQDPPMMGSDVAVGAPSSGFPPDARVSGAFNARLYDALEAAGVSDEELNGYLRGTLGEPRIPKPVLAGDMTIHTLGERIVNVLLDGGGTDGRKNWDLVVERIKKARK